MTFTTRFQFKSNVDGIVAELKSRSKRNVQAATLHMRNELIDKVNNSGAGHQYPIRPETGKLEAVEVINKNGHKQKVKKIVGATIHQASSPGDPPAVLRAYLKASFQTEFEETETMYQGYVGPVNIPYAKALEFGFMGKDKNGKKHNLEPRPYMLPTYHEQRENIMRIIRRGRI
ncbi:hypothetical protein [Bacillus sp. Hm123]|uniref:hypothetical protein n=1 Tax=Bacillus sp. Hm123 TaxID=3450745 RepID=UPI003F41FE1E